MRVVALALVVACSACWTGPAHPVEPLLAQEGSAQPAPPPAPEPPVDLDVTMERTACFGHCPEYAVEIEHDGTVVWHGIANVTMLGTARARITRAQLRRLAREVDSVRFFELDENGQLPEPPRCVQSAGTMSCTFRGRVVGCTDTSHAVITVRRGGKAHTVDDAHCEGRTVLTGLEEMVDRMVGAKERIGR